MNQFKTQLCRFTAQSYLLLLVACITLPAIGQNSLELRGNVELQGRYFTQEALWPTQSSGNFSLAIEPEAYFSWNNDNDSIEFVPFARVDQRDDKRTHADIRELSWVHVGNNWESRIGIRRVFWGVTEFQHLVDIINQTDGVEDIDGEDKLGQPMLNLSLVRDWGILDLYALPYFRERTFASLDGRPAFPFLNTDFTTYESSNEEHHFDYAIRFTQSYGDFDVGLSWFDGTSRDPLIIASPRQTILPELAPFYQQIKQLGLDLQATIDDTLWKLELIHNQNKIDSYYALQGGFEWTHYGIMESAADLGLLVEYGWDQRGKTATGISQNDIYLGARFALNDAASTQILGGLSYDLDYDSKSLLIEASKRVGDHIKMSADIRLFQSNQPEDTVFLFKQDDHIQLTIQYFY